MDTSSAKENPEEEAAVEVEKVLLAKLQAGIDSNTPWSGIFTRCKELLEKKLDSTMDRRARARFRQRAYLLSNLMAEHDSVFDHVNIGFGYRLKQIMDDIELDPKVEAAAGTQPKKPLIESQTERVPSRAATPTEWFGFDVDLMAMENLLLCRGTSPEFNAVGIYGAEGVGKTTLAQIIFQCDKIRSMFLPRIWICLADHPDDDKRDSAESFLAKRILLQLGFDRGFVNRMDQSAIRSELLRKKYLIVLDGASEDVEHNGRLMQMLRDTLPMGTGGAVMVTGRAENVVKEMVGGGANAVHRLLPLDKPVLCWDIYKAAAEEEEEDSADVDEKQKVKNEVVKRSDGLPWASTLLGILRREIKRRPRRSSNGN